ncbi:hypothetical protein M8J77_022851 [Diaphorina citri]|nr:hypothetical protein M8J77_022851 [Diaphorina citri]
MDADFSSTSIFSNSTFNSGGGELTTPSPSISSVDVSENAISSSYKGLKILDGNFFSLVEEKSCQEQNQAVARCTLCDKQKEIKGQFSATTNFLKHLKRTHGQRNLHTFVPQPTWTASYMDFFDFGGDEEEEEKECESATSIVAQQQIFNYFSNPSQEFEMLEAYPAIKKVFLKTNVILPSSAPVERLFSFASITNTPKANRL